MRKATTLPAVLAMLVAGLAATAGPAQARRGMEVALQDDAMFVYGGYAGAITRDQALDRAAALGVTRVRSNVSWALVTAQVHHRRAPKHPTYNWGPWDSLIDGAAQRGIRVELTLTGFAPAYATANHRVGVDKPSAKRFGQFVAAAARHFRGRVNVYTVWNEPNIRPWLQPMSKAPALYRAMYVAAEKAIHRYDRGARVLIGETSPYGIRGRAMPPIAFLRKMLCVNARYHKTRHCRKLVADGYAHHPYEFKHKPTYRYKGADNATIGTLGHLTGALSKLARAHVLTTRSGHALPLYLTEFGYDAKGSRRLPEAKRASYLTKAFSIAYHNPHVRSMVAYLLVVPPTRSSFAMGLMKPSGTALKSYTALHGWVRKAHVKKRPKRIRLPRAR
jgi:GH35 family endo-1,4-beta-xylanase